MNLKTCYEKLEGDYADVLSRFNREPLVQRFVFKFLEDNSYEQFHSAMQAKDYETAFRAAHTMKGICQNLSFTKLYLSSNALTEALRLENYQDVAALIPAFSSDYLQTVNAITTYKDTLEE